jgi:hypothetical protein
MATSTGAPSGSTAGSNGSSSVADPNKPFDFSSVDDDYVTRMIAFELDCNDGKGAPMPCHQVGEFWSVVKNDHKRAAQVYEKNCVDNNYAPSCFNLARFYSKSIT